jgi:prepilin peptidase CpaA
MFDFLQILLALAFPALVLTAAFRDLTSYTIPNWISLALVAAFIPASLACGLTFQSIALHVGVAAAALVAGMAMFAFRWIGGGDAKLFAAAALWLGWPSAAPFVLMTGLAGGGLAMALLALRSVWLRPLASQGPGWLARLAAPEEAVPYGLAIALGALVAFAQSPFGHLLSL